MLIVMAAQEMGWDIAITNKDDNEELNGMIIGTSDYINNTLGIDKQENNSQCSCGDDCSNTCCKSE